MEFKEYLIKKRKTIKESILSVLLYIAALIVSFAAFALLPSMFSSLSALLAAAAFYGAYRLSTKFNVEYEYIITGDSVDIDAIYNAARRKRIISFSVKDVEIIASVNDVNNNHLLKGEFKNTIDATSGFDAKVYFAVVEKNGRLLVKFEPPHAALEVLKKFAPSKVVITD